MPTPALRAISDLHVDHPDNRRLVEHVRAEDPGDWLIVAGDIGDRFADVEWTLSTLRKRFARVIWAPGNHELWTRPGESEDLRGVARYDALVDLCRRLGVDSPEDEFPVWTGAGGPVIVAPLFLLYDYSFLTPGTSTVAESFAKAEQAGVICTDEYLLHPDPYESRADWCSARLEHTAARLDAVAGSHPLVLVTHWPLVRAPTAVLRFPEFAQWCGTTRTADWHLRYQALVAVYGHLHIPRSTVYDGTRFEEVSVGYPREWRRSGLRSPLARQILPAPSGGDR